jgi:hypothetical protein
MFEKMGSADDLLDDSPAKAAPRANMPVRASSVGRNYERRPSDMGSKFVATSVAGVGSASTGSVRSRSIRWQI